MPVFAQCPYKELLHVIPPILLMPLSLTEGGSTPKAECDAGFYCTAGSYTAQPCPNENGLCTCDGDENSIGGEFVIIPHSEH